MTSYRLNNSGYAPLYLRKLVEKVENPNGYRYFGITGLVKSLRKFIRGEYIESEMANSRYYHYPYIYDCLSHRLCQYTPDDLGNIRLCYTQYGRPGLFQLGINGEIDLFKGGK